MTRATNLALLTCCGLAASATAQTAPSTRRPVAPGAPAAQSRPVADSGAVRVRPGSRGETLVYSATLSAPEPGAPWVRLAFRDVALPGNTETERTASIVITSLLDGAQQRLNADDLRQWADSSAYFNGPSVRLDLYSWPGLPDARIAVDRVIAPASGGNPEDSLCGPDDRLLSSDARVGRLFPEGCTAFLISDQAHCLLTAGSCAPTAGSVVEFNVPLSTSAGGIQHPPPSSQFAVDPASLHTQNAGPGNDWAYFGVFVNPGTHMGAAAMQGSSYTTAAAPAPGAGATLRITGYGTVTLPVSLTWNQVQKLGLGPYVSLVGTTIGHQANTTTGNAGSPVELAGQVIGINNGDGCLPGDPNATNTATAIQNAALQAALASPSGVCARPTGTVTPPVYLAGAAAGELLTLRRNDAQPGAVGAAAPGPFAGLAYDRNRARFYGSRLNAGPDDLFAIDPITGAATLIAPISGPPDISGLAFDPNTDTLYGIDQGSGLLYRVSFTTGSTEPVGANVNLNVGALDFDPVTGTLYALQDAAGGTRLLKLSTTSAFATAVGNLGPGITDCDGLAFCIQDGFLYTVDQPTGQMLRVNPLTGLASPVGAVGAALGSGFGMASADTCSPPCLPNSPIPSNGQVEVFIASSIYWYACPNQKLYAVDPNPDLLYDILSGTGQPTLIGPVSGSQQITGLTWDGSRLVAVDLPTGNLLTVSRQSGATSVLGNTGITGWQDIACDHTDLDQLYGITQNNFLYRISPTGPATPVAGNVGNIVAALAFDVTGQLWGVEFTTGRVLRINKNTGAITHITTTIAGIQGIAFDDAGTLFAVNSSTDSLYTINLQTGAATLRGPTQTEFLSCMAFGMSTFLGGGEPGGGGGDGGGAGHPGPLPTPDPRNITRELTPVIDRSLIIDGSAHGLPPGMTASGGELIPGGTIGLPVPPQPPANLIACGGTSITFDTAYGTCAFSQTTRATTQFADRGLILDGPGGNDGPAILNQCAALGISGYSAPNVLAFNSASSLSDGGTARGPLTLRFTTPISSFSANVAGPAGGQVTLQAYSGPTLVDTRTVGLTPAMSAVSVGATGITRIVATSTAGAWAMDDLCYVQSCPTLYDVYFGTDNPPPLVLSNSPNTYFRTPSMLSTTLYYWRIVAKNCCGQTSGPTWHFSTICYANCDGSTIQPILNVLDFNCFLNRFGLGDTWANCDGSTTPPVLNVLDFNCFLNRFVQGCPNLP